MFRMVLDAMIDFVIDSITLSSINEHCSSLPPKTSIHVTKMSSQNANAMQPPFMGPAQTQLSNVAIVTFRSRPRFPPSPPIPLCASTLDSPRPTPCTPYVTPPLPRFGFAAPHAHSLPPGLVRPATLHAPVVAPSLWSAPGPTASGSVCGAPARQRSGCRRKGVVCQGGG